MAKGSGGKQKELQGSELCFSKPRRKIHHSHLLFLNCLSVPDVLDRCLRLSAGSRRGRRSFHDFFTPPRLFRPTHPAFHCPRLGAFPVAASASIDGSSFSDINLNKVLSPCTVLPKKTKQESCNVGVPVLDVWGRSLELRLLCARYPYPHCSRSR